MDNDIYLGLAAELYEKGTWDKDTFIKKVTLYARESKIDGNLINEYIRRVTKQKEYSIDEKRNFLSVLTLDGHELKYGDIVVTMSEEVVEKFYDMESSLLSQDRINAYHSLAKVKNKSNQNVSSVSKDETTALPINDKNDLEPQVVKKAKIDIEKIVNDDYDADYLLGKTEKEADELLEELISNVKPEQFNSVVESLSSKLGKDYSRVFAIEWGKRRSAELDKIKNNKKEENVNTIVSTEENKGMVEEAKETDVNPVDINEQKEEVVPPLNFEEDIPQTEEEFKNQAKNVTEPEKDSNVTFIEAPKERIEKLKKSKGKIINYFLKTIVLIGALTLLSASSSITLIGGYLFFANKIRNGNFNPNNAVEKAIKAGVEKVMYMGMTKSEIENERGKIR